MGQGYHDQWITLLNVPSPDRSGPRTSGLRFQVTGSKGKKMLCTESATHTDRFCHAYNRAHIAAMYLSLCNDDWKAGSSSDQRKHPLEQVPCCKTRTRSENYPSCIPCPLGTLVLSRQVRLPYYNELDPILSHIITAVKTTSQWYHTGGKSWIGDGCHCSRRRSSRKV